MTFTTTIARNRARLVGIAATAGLHRVRRLPGGAGAGAGRPLRQSCRADDCGESFR
jgi:hypothetical protein